jgi:molybdopterin-binding protein
MSDVTDTAEAAGHHAESVAAGIAGHPGPEAAVVADGVHRSFGDRVVLDGVDLVIDPGEFVVLLGRSGTGKSTLLRALAGLDPDYGGHLLVPRARAVVFQEPRLLPWARVLANVTLGLEGGRRRVAARGREALAEVGLAGHERAWPSTLSGGEAQRVALARALVHEPRVLILDEPLSAVDAAGRGRLRALLKERLARFEGYRLLVTHDPVEAGALADHLVILERGRVTQEGTPDEIRSAPRTRYAAELVGVNLFAGRLVPLGDGAGRLVTPDGGVVVPWPDRPEEPLEEVLGFLHPSDVSLFRSRPEGSARNIVLGRVELVTVEGSRARLRIEGKPPLVAEVTPGSVDRLALREGDRVWAAFKAVEVRLLLP